MPLSDDETFAELAYLREEVLRLRASLNLLTPRIDILLKRRGFTVYKKEPSEDRLIPSKKYLRSYFQMLHKYSFRLFLRDVIKHQGIFTLEQVTRYATPGVTKDYLDYLI